ncbi:MAG: ABC transporter ATP-binding protein [Nannocystis sp.]|nr:ABC transporter ATP-binding protein [Nannocystis sp.]
MPVILEAHDLVKRYPLGDGSVDALRGVSLSVAKGEFVAIMGSSGSGKSTMLHLLGGLDRPDSGDVTIEGVALSSLDDPSLARLRNRRIGFVFQFHHLLRDFTARENVMMPLLIDGVAEHTARERADAILAQLGIAARTESRVTLMSGGEQQRVALARAMVTTPAVLLADEPTGNLDPPTAARMHELLTTIARVERTAVVAVTHSRALAALADRVLALEDGVLRPADRVEAIA